MPPFLYMDSMKKRLLVTYIVNCCADSLDSLHHSVSACGEVNSDVAFASFLTVHGAGIDIHSAFAEQCVADFFCGETCAPDVYPHEVSALESGDFQLRTMLLNVGA